MFSSVAILAAAGGYGRLAGTRPSLGEGRIIPRHGIFELAIRHEAKLANPFWDAATTAEFTSPAGAKVTVDGFCHGHHGGDEWRIRFVPRDFGNQGVLSNVDPVKWRIAVWTAFMNESSMLFWGMSGRKVPAGREKPSGNANAYIGPDSRRHFRVLNEFTADLPIDLRPAPIGYHRQSDIRTYALSNGQVTVLYIHHFSDHQKEYQLPWKLMAMTGPGRFRLTWIDPEDGSQIKTEELSTPQHYLEFQHPPVKVDLACRIDRVGDPAPVR